MTETCPQELGAQGGDTFLFGVKFSDPFTRLPPQRAPTTTPHDATPLTILTILRSMHTERASRCPTNFLPVGIPWRTTLQ